MFCLPDTCRNQITCFRCSVECLSQNHASPTPPKRPGQNGLFHQADLAQSIFGGFSDVPFLRKKIIKDADNFLLFGEGGDRDNKST